MQLSNKICILDIDTQGVQLLKKTHLNPVYVFIKPPSMKVLEDRLRGRSTETEESLQKRLSVAEKEMEYGTDKNIVMQSGLKFTTLLSRYSARKL